MGSLVMVIQGGLRCPRLSVRGLLVLLVAVLLRLARSRFVVAQEVVLVVVVKQLAVLVVLEGRMKQSHC
jgi:hypothetical protein